MGVGREQGRAEVMWAWHGGLGALVRTEQGMGNDRAGRGQCDVLPLTALFGLFRPDSKSATVTKDLHLTINSHSY